MVYLTPFGDEGPLGDDPPEDRAKEVQLAAKDEDEIKRFTVDENLGDIEKAILYLKGGHPWQQACAIESIPRLLRARKTQALEAIQKHLGAAIQTLEAEGQISLATMFTEVLKDRLLPPKELVSWIKPIVLKGTAANKTSEEHEAWMTALQELLPLLDVSALREVMSIALTSGSVEEDVQSRTRCCRLLGALARHMTPEDVERSFLKKVLALCQDTDYEVRICMCEQTATLGAAVGNDLTTKKLLPEVLELLKDEEVSVQTVAMTTLLDLVETLPTQTIKESVMPVLRLYMQPLDLEPEMQRCIAKIFGPMVVKIAPCFESETDSGLFFGCYRFLASRSEAQLRQDCARNFPGILKMASPKLYAAHFHDTFAQLAVDADDEVRRIIAAQFHEITRMLEPDVCLQFLRPPLETLLKDTFPPVRAEIMKMLSTVLSRMHTSDQEQRHRALQSLVHPLVELSKLVGRDWRQDLNLAGALPRFVESFSSEAIFTCFVPIAFDRLANGAAAVKIAAADGVAAFLRHNKSEKQRTQIFVRIIREFARGKSVWSRMTFVDLSRHILRRFSTKFFKDHMLDYYIDLMHDPIPNVRLHSCSLLPNMKQTVKLPEDVDQLERLNSAMSNLMTDSDRDVSSTAREIHNAFKRMPVRMTGGAGVLDMNGMAAGQSEFEEEDRRKEEEEVDLTLAQEEIEQLIAEREPADFRVRRRRCSDSSLSTSVLNAGSSRKSRLLPPSTNPKGRRPVEDIRAGSPSSPFRSRGSIATSSTPIQTSTDSRFKLRETRPVAENRAAPRGTSQSRIPPGDDRFPATQRSRLTNPSAATGQDHTSAVKLPSLQQSPKLGGRTTGGGRGKTAGLSGRNRRFGSK